MFSDKIICAIRIISHLVDAPLGRRNAHGIDTGALKKLLDVESALYKSVINAMITDGICSTTTRMIYLCKGAERVTIYDLMELFHKGVPLGAVMEIDWNKGDYLYDTRYSRLRSIEEGIEKELKKQMRNMHILELIAPKPAKKHGGGIWPANTVCKRIEWTGRQQTI